MGRLIEGQVGVKPQDAKASNAAGPSPIVEDTTRVGGVDETGAHVVGNRRPDGTVDESVRPTDPREKP
jgi:hypothetical protein